jgi:hypothetical protein
MHWKIEKKQGESDDLHQFNPDIFSKGKKVTGERREKKYYTIFI